MVAPHGGHGHAAHAPMFLDQLARHEIATSTAVVLAVLLGSALGMGSGHTMEVAGVGGIGAWIALLVFGPCAAEGSASLKDAAKFCAYGLAALVGGGWLFFGVDPTSWKTTYGVAVALVFFLGLLWVLSPHVKGHAEFLGPYVTLAGFLVLAVVLAAQVRGYVWVGELAPPFGKQTRPAVAAWGFLGLPWNFIVPICLLWGIGVGIKMVKALHHHDHPNEGQVWVWFLPFIAGATLVFSVIP